MAGPILTYLRDLERRWYQYLLHNQRAQVLTALLTLDGDERIAVINVPWYIKA